MFYGVVKIIKLEQVVCKRDNRNFIKGGEYIAKISGEYLSIYDPKNKQWESYSNKYLSIHLSIFMNFEIKNDSVTYVKDKKELKEFIKIKLMGEN